MAPQAPLRYQGEVVEWNQEKRCGFILPRGSRDSTAVVYLAAHAFIDRRSVPQVGDAVIFEVVQARESPNAHRLRTKLRAQKVAFPRDEPSPETPEGESGLALLATAHLIIQLISATLVPRLMWLAIGALVLSLLSFIQYGRDKKLAQKNRHRVPERDLHLLALLGGWPGAALAQKVFRHKTQKRPFQTVFRLLVALNIALTFGIYVWLSRS